MDKTNRDIPASAFAYEFLHVQRRLYVRNGDAHNAPVALTISLNVWRRKRKKPMGNFKAVYRILNFLKKSEQFDEFDDESFDAGHFGLTERQWTSTLERMINDGLIQGVSL